MTSNLTTDNVTRTHCSYIMSLILKRIFLFKCNVSMLRLTTTLNLLALPLVLTRLLAFHKRIRPPSSLLAPFPEAIVLALFPIAWFFGFLYYTETPSLLFVAWTVVAASEDKHWLAALVRSLDVIGPYELRMQMIAWSYKLHI